MHHHLTAKLGLALGLVLVIACLVLVLWSAGQGPSGHVFGANTPTGSISGHVYQADGKTPLAGATVVAYPSAPGPGTITTTTTVRPPTVATTTTTTTTAPPPTSPLPKYPYSISAPDGSYVIIDLPPGTYDIYATAREGYPVQYYSGAYKPEDATPVTVNASTETAGIDFWLGPGGSIVGHVYQPDGVTPVGSARVRATPINGTAPFQVLSTADGSYLFSNLAAGLYRIYAFVESYMPEYYFGVQTPEEATPVAVTALATTAGIDFTLKTGGIISGHVFESDGETAINGAKVYATSKNGGFGETISRSDGSYSITGLITGNYSVRAGASGYVADFYDDVTYPSDATPVFVQKHVETTQIDFRLERPGSISGHIYQGDGVTPIANADLRARDVTGYSGGSGKSNADGSYIIGNLISGNYTVWATWNGLTEYYFNTVETNATRVSVLVPYETKNIDFILETGGAISGHVYEIDGSIPLSGASVSATPVGGGTPHYVYSDNDGSYRITGLVAGNYTVLATASDHLHQYYDHASIPDQAIPVRVSGPGETKGIDFVLDKVGSIRGHVYQPDGLTPVNGLQVNATSVDGRYYRDGTTASDGSYVVEFLPSSDYLVSIKFGSYPRQYYNGTYSTENATRVRVSRGAATAGIDFVVVSGLGSLSGHVHESDGKTPIPGAQVSLLFPNGAIAATANTAQDGAYLFANLAAGRYRVYASADHHFRQYYRGASVLGNATPVDVIASHEVTDIDFALEPSGSISGHVYQPNGVTPVEGAELIARLGNVKSFTAKSARDGSFTISGLPSGNFTVSVSASGYVSQYYDGAFIHEEASNIPVAAPHDTADIDFHLQPVGNVAVRISSPPLLAPRAEFSVRVNITSVVGLGAYQFDVMYDPKVVEVKAVSSGSVDSRAMPLDMWGFTPEHVQGHVRVLGHIQPENSVSGSGYLVEIRFQVIGNRDQTSSIDLSNGRLFDPFTNEITPVSWVGAVISIPWRGDANCDGLVNMGDITRTELMILELSELSCDADANVDGLVNMGDVVRIENIILGLD